MSSEFQLYRILCFARANGGCSSTLAGYATANLITQSVRHFVIVPLIILGLDFVHVAGGTHLLGVSSISMSYLFTKVSELVSYVAWYPFYNMGVLKVKP